MENFDVESVLNLPLGRLSTIMENNIKSYL
jgi:hypothetical protein